MLITDTNPYLAAKAVPEEYIEPTIITIEHAYNIAVCENKMPSEIYVVSDLQDLIIYDFLYSRKNAEWYEKFYKALCDIHKYDNRLMIHMQFSSLRTKGSGLYMVNPLQLHSPMLDKQYQPLVQKHRERYAKIKDIIILSRVMLIDMQPELEDFPAGMPPWLVDVSLPMIEAFDTLNRRHIKIERDSEGKLHYFTSLISDKWEEIQNVPREMDYIVLYLATNKVELNSAQ